MSTVRRCCLTMLGHDSLPKPCTRRPVYVITYFGALCSYHFEQHLTTHTVDPKDIIRLSNDESDFVVRSEIGKGRNVKSV